MMETWSYESEGAEVRALLAPPPRREGAPIVIVLPAIAGVNPYVLRVAQRLAARGYAAFVLDYYAREGEPPDISTRPKIMKAVANLSDVRVASDLAALLEVVGEDPALGRSSVATLGFCIGGMFSFLAACDHDLACAVTYYGALRYSERSETKPVAPLDRVGDLRAPLLAHFGTADRLISSSDVAELEEKLRTHGCVHEVFAYRGAPHAFDEDFRDAFRPAAASDAWRRTTDFIDWHLRSRARY